MRRRALLAGVLSVGACGLSERPYAEKREWPLAVARTPALPARASGRILLVRDTRAAPGLEIRGLQTLRPDGSVAIDFYEEWSVPPADAVASGLRQWLSDAGLFAAVTAPGSRLAADLVLEANLTALVYDAAKKVGRVTLGIVLIDQRPNAVRILVQRRLTAERPLATSDPAQIAATLRACLRDVFGQAEAAVAPYATVRGPGGGGPPAHPRSSRRR